jgi:hypothetical protein
MKAFVRCGQLLQQQVWFWFKARFDVRYLTVQILARQTKGPEFSNIDVILLHEKDSIGAFHDINYFL